MSLCGSGSRAERLTSKGLGAEVPNKVGVLSKCGLKRTRVKVIIDAEWPTHLFLVCLVSRVADDGGTRSRLPGKGRRANLSVGGGHGGKENLANLPADDFHV